MTGSSSPLERQPGLFESLPTTEPRRRRVRPRSPLANPETAPEAAPAAEPVPSFAEPPQAPFRPLAPMAARVDVAALSRPDISDLVHELSEASLSFLLVEAAREAKRRLVLDDPEAETAAEPSPQLLRAIRTVVAELAEEE